jgi:hypothetical protein
VILVTSLPAGAFPADGYSRPLAPEVAHRTIAVLRPHLHRRGGRGHDPADEQGSFQL